MKARLLFAAAFLLGCGGEILDEDGPPQGTSNGTCDPATLVFETGDLDGHEDPLGAKSAGQARAGRIMAADVPQPAHGRQRIEDGDFLLVNDRIAVVIEDKDISDGNGRFGGEILAVDRVGDDGQPLGQSMFLETLQLTSLYQINPTSVTVMNDGSDGQAASVRVTGPLEAIPFLADTFGGAFPPQYADLIAAYDFILEPGAEKLLVRFGFVNTTEYAIDTGLEFEGSWNLLGFFQGSQNDNFAPGIGFAKPSGTAPWAGFDNDLVPFAYQGPGGEPIDFGGIDVAGFQVWSGPGMIVEPCSVTMVDDHEIVAGDPGAGVDGLGEAVRRANGLPAWRLVTGIVTDSTGAGVPGAYVHVTDAEGAYVNRAKSEPCGVGDDCGAFRVHVPEGSVTLVAQKRGYGRTAGLELEEGTRDVELSFDPNGFVHVVVTDAGSGGPMPARIQVIPTVPVDATPEAYGDPDEANGRLWQEFSVTGDATLAVPPGNHRIVVSHGYEWELVDVTLDVAAGQTVEVPASLARSIDTTGAMSADFHIHSMFSVDSSDPVVHKVRGALADGVEIPVSSEHEWIFDFQPIIEDLGAQAWAFGLPSQELTTFTFGHFGVVPAPPRPELVNNGAVEWLDKTAQQIFDDVHALPTAPALIVNHPSGDSAFQSYFTKVQLDRETGTSPDPLWSESFDAIEVFNESDFESNRDESVADWFALMNSGKTYWAVGSSDSHALRTNPIGYPRSFVFLGYDDPTLVEGDDVRDAILGGRITIGGGLFMTVDGPDGSRPGDTVTKTATADFTVTVQCPSWVPADTLEVIVNGETVSTEPLAPVGGGPGKRFVNAVSVTLPAGPRAWVLFHAKGPGDLAPVHPGREPFAVSNPILFQE